MGILAVLAVVGGLAMLSAAAEAAPTIDGTIDSGEYDTMVKYDSDRYEVHWTIANGELWMGIRAQTTGWAAIGFDPTDRMKDADMVFGWVDGSGVLTIYDAYATGVNGPHPVDTDLGGTDDITEADGTEAAGWTTLEFRRDLDTGDTYDNVIPTDGTIPLIWAVGPSDDFVSQHMRRGGTTWPNDAVVEVNSAPSWVYAGEDVEVVYWINLTVWDHTAVTHTAIHWDTMSHGEPLDFQSYPNNSVPGVGEPDGVYETSFVAPTEPGTVYMIVHAIVGGNHYYAMMEYMVMVKAMPTIDVVEPPPSTVFTDTGGDVIWMISGAEDGEVTHTAVHWDTVSHGEPLDFNNYAEVLLGTSTGTAGEYSAYMSAPSTPGDIYFVFHAIVNGRHVYAAMEYHVTVIDVPVIQLVDITDKVFVDGTAKVWWDIPAVDLMDVTHTAIHWDTTSHAGGAMDFQVYPNAILGVDGGNDSDYMVMMEAPSDPTTVYLVIHAIVMDTHIYAEMEYTISVVDEPEMELVAHTEMVFVDGTAKVWWNINGLDAVEDVTHTAIHWDTASHSGGPLDFTMYPNAVPGEDGGDDSDYMAMMTAPSAPASVFFVVHAIVLDVHFYAAMEYEIVVGDLPVLENVDFDEAVFAGGPVTVTWDVSGVAPDDVTHTAVHWDTSSKGTPPDFTAYANAAAGEANSPDSDYKAMFTAPTTGGPVYFVVHAIVMDTHIYAGMEYMVEVMDMPEVVLVDHTERVLVDGTAEFWWDIEGVSMDEVSHTAVHWDTTSHAGGALDFNLYPNALMGMDGGDESDYKVAMDAPSSPGTVYFVVHAIVMDAHFYAVMEYTVTAVARPTVSLVDQDAVVYLGGSAYVWWDVVDAAEQDLTHTALHWDTTSHSGGAMDFNMYPNMVLGGDGSPDSDYRAMVSAPASQGTVYLILHAIVLGEDFYASMEYTIDVFEEPSMGNIIFKARAETGDKVTIRFTMPTHVMADRVSHVGVHWDTTSRGEPLDFSSYANAETVDPDPNGVYDVTFQVPDKAGEVYFVIHAIVDGMDVYAEDTEYSITVEKAEEEGSSMMTYAIIGIVVVVLIAVAAFAMMGRGGASKV